jgi:hypothetical protein
MSVSGGEVVFSHSLPARRYCRFALVGLMLAVVGRIEVARAEVPDDEGRTVKVGAELFRRSVVVNDAILGGVTDIIRNPTKNDALGVAGLNGAVFIRPDGSTRFRLQFEEAKRRGAASRVQFVDADGHHNWQYFDRGGHGWSDAALYDRDGLVIWTYGGETGLDDMAAGDLDGDRKLDFVAGYNGFTGIRRIDRNTKLVWKLLGGNIWHVEIADTGDGKPKIVHTDGAQLAIRDADGKLIRRISPGTELGFFRTLLIDFSMCHWPDEKSPCKILSVGRKLVGSDLILWGFDSQVVGRYSLPDSDKFMHVYGAAVHQKKGEPPWLAVVAPENLSKYSLLVVYNAKREIVYQEQLPGAGAALLSVPNADTGRDDLLVGGDGIVWKYSFNSQATPRAAGGTAAPAPSRSK